MCPSRLPARARACHGHTEYAVYAIEGKGFSMHAARRTRSGSVVRMIISGSAVCSTFAQGSAFAAEPFLPSPAERLSRFFGVAECTAGKRSFNMVLRGGNRASLPGEVSLVAGGPAAPGGLYSVKASIDNRGVLIVTPVAWIGRPAARPMLGFNGLTKPDGTVVAAQTSTPGCGKVSLVLDSDDGFHPVLSAEYSVYGHKPVARPIVLPLKISQQAKAAPPPAPTRPAARVSPTPSGYRRSSLPANVVAKGNPNGWVSHDDYPSRARRELLTGEHTITLTIGPDGRVSNCRPVVISGDPTLADNSCQHATRRARFGLRPGVMTGTVGGTFVMYLKYFCNEESECLIGTRVEK